MVCFNKTKPKKDFKASLTLQLGNHSNKALNKETLSLLHPLGDFVRALYTAYINNRGVPIIGSADILAIFTTSVIGITYS